MALTPGESDRLLLHLQALLAERRQARGLALNAPEATALIADAVCEWARDGENLATVRARARTLLSVDDVLPGVPEVVGEVRVEARFDDGTRLVVVSDPFGAADGGTGVPAVAPDADAWLAITNESTIAIGLTSHIHLAEVNPRLRLDRAAAFGQRLAIPTGDTEWVLAGETREFPVCRIRGARVQVGTSGLVDGDLDDPACRDRALSLLRECGFLDVVEGEPLGSLAQADQAMVRAMDVHRSGNTS